MELVDQTLQKRMVARPELAQVVDERAQQARDALESRVPMRERKATWRGAADCRRSCPQRGHGLGVGDCRRLQPVGMQLLRKPTWPCGWRVARLRERSVESAARDSTYCARFWLERCPPPARVGVT